MLSGSVVIVIRAWFEAHPSAPFRAVVTWTTPEKPPAEAGTAVKSPAEVCDEVRAILRRTQGDGGGDPPLAT